MVIEMSSRVNISVSVSTKAAITRCQADPRLLDPGSGSPSATATKAQYNYHTLHLGKALAGGLAGEGGGDIHMAYGSG